MGTKNSELMGKRVLTDVGTEIGNVTDVEFNPGTGAIVSLLTASGPIYGDRLIDSGSYAVVVKHG